MLRRCLSASKNPICNLGHPNIFENQDLRLNAINSVATLLRLPRSVPTALLVWVDWAIAHSELGYLVELVGLFGH